MSWRQGCNHKVKFGEGVIIRGVLKCLSTTGTAWYIYKCCCKNGIRFVTVLGKQCVVFSSFIAFNTIFLLQSMSLQLPDNSLLLLYLHEYRTPINKYLTFFSLVSFIYFFIPSLIMPLPVYFPPEFINKVMQKAL